VEYGGIRALRKFAKAMINALQWEFGACDVLIGQGGEMYALEANSAPAMDDYTLAAYVKAIRKRFSNAD
jgi:D-alanine-D-alanine ligase-like ATP-grasp enzyme